MKKARRICFLFFIIFFLFYKIIIFRLTKKKDIRGAYLYFNFFHETVNSHYLETASFIAHVIFVLHIALRKHTYWPIKTHVLSKLFFTK